MKLDMIGRMTLGLALGIISNDDGLELIAPVEDGLIDVEIVNDAVGGVSSFLGEVCQQVRSLTTQGRWLGTGISEAAR
ncbi:hypothetical protein B0T13DRAFT_480510 [Neurospora crassa]|nr:hypothetical protein B0T13DRAFT_484575 [Neurospora crassa]KAK3489720.1 hypothetical protein B0T13DRAFT_480510 [Neurospora crassa]